LDLTRAIAALHQFVNTALIDIEGNNRQSRLGEGGRHGQADIPQADYRNVPLRAPDHCHCRHLGATNPNNLWGILPFFVRKVTGSPLPTAAKPNLSTGAAL